MHQHIFNTTLVDEVQLKHGKVRVSSSKKWSWSKTIKNSLSTPQNSFVAKQPQLLKNYRKIESNVIHSVQGI